jgi:hypothetical protein
LLFGGGKFSEPDVISFLLDCLTVVFIVTGCVLLWFNLRKTRRGSIVDQTPPILPSPTSNDHNDQLSTPNQATALEALVIETLRSRPTTLPDRAASEEPSSSAPTKR